LSIAVVVLAKIVAVAGAGAVPIKRLKEKARRFNEAAKGYRTRVVIMTDAIM
jgi:regulator of extracellular matrix RemA (YlzA/DUF370 family)